MSSLPLSPSGNILFIIYSPSLLARDRLLYKRTNLDNIYFSTYLYIFFKNGNGCEISFYLLKILTKREIFEIDLTERTAKKKKIFLDTRWQQQIFL